jgi:Predicted Co/Zn/Cd cation transporters
MVVWGLEYEKALSFASGDALSNVWRLVAYHRLFSFLQLILLAGFFLPTSHVHRNGDIHQIRNEHTENGRFLLNDTALIKRGLLLEYLTLGWNVVGVIIVIIAAYAARSVALAGFGLDSLIEIFASVVVVWQLTGVDQRRERLALRLIGIAFIALVIYILVQLFYTFLMGTHATTSVGGITWITATFIAMLLLAFGKRITGQQLKNEVLLTEGRVTLVDAYLAGAVLVGLVLNASLGWWWADSLASLVIVYYGVREALHALRESAQSGAQPPVQDKER